MTTGSIAVLYATNQITDAARWSSSAEQNIGLVRTKEPAEAEVIDRGEGYKDNFPDLSSAVPGLCLLSRTYSRDYEEVSEIISGG